MTLETAKAILAIATPNARQFAPGYSATELAAFEQRMARLREKGFVFPPRR